MFLLFNYLCIHLSSLYFLHEGLHSKLDYHWMRAPVFPGAMYFVDEKAQLVFLILSNLADASLCPQQVFLV